MSARVWLLLALAGLAVLAAGFAAPSLLSAGDLRLGSEILLIFTMAQMWNLLAGYAGLVSLGQQAFIGVGGYAMFATTNDFAVSPYIGMLAALLTSGLLAAAMAPLMFRLRNAYFSIGTWVFAEIVRILVTKSDWLGGSSGMPFQNVAAFGADFAGACFDSALAAAFCACVATQLAMRSKLGLALMAIRDNELAAASSGISVIRYRMLAFIFSGSVCGVAGAIYFAQALFIDTNSAFDVNWGVILLFIVIVGGIGTTGGPVVGTLLYFAVRELFEDAGNWYMILIGAIAFATMMIAPSGIWGQISRRTGISDFGLRRRISGDELNGEPSKKRTAPNF